jgi:hypothetical protein
VNASLYVVPGILATWQALVVAHVRQSLRGRASPTPLDISRVPLILAKVIVSLLLLLLVGGEIERDTAGGTPRRIMANSVDNPGLRMSESSPGGSSIEPKCE